MSNCIFCRIIQREIPAKIIFEDQTSLAFEDVNPRAPVHILIIPKKHIESIDSMEESDRELLGHLSLLARNIARERKVDQTGYRCVTNTGPNAGQSVFHIHVHLLGGRPMAWPPG